MKHRGVVCAGKLSFVLNTSILLVSTMLGIGNATAGGMATPVGFAVNETGAANLNIPIEVPPGTAGIAPSLSLNYTSQGGNGLLGMGWYLSGLSSVTRCPRTLAQDGVKGGINFDGNDRLCMDGQRLILISGTYGADGAEYRTERESFSKIISYGSAGNGPAWLKVWTKAGQIIEYGNTTDSRIEAQGKTSARAWAINKVSDTKGNYLTFSYTEDTTNGDYYPSHIDYTGNAGAGLVPNASVQFQYETRPDSVPLYFLGSLIKNTQRLKTVQTWVGSTEVREYRLTYGTSPSSGRSRIASLTECAMPDNSCKPAITPTWSEYGSNAFSTGTGWTTLTAGYLADLNGDGKADLIAQQSDGLYVALSTGSGAGTSSKWANGFGTGTGYPDPNTTPIFLLDVNGDGLADAVGFASDGVYVALSYGAGFNAAGKWISDFGAANGWNTMDTYPRTLADVNGDGLPDIVGFKSDGVYVSLNTGSGFGTTTKWAGDFGTASPIAYASNSANPRIVQDINGDGLPDIVGFANGGTYVALNTGTGFAAATLWLADFGVSAGYTTQDAYPRALADINGDGLPDIIGFKSDGVYVALNTGSGFQTASKWLADFGTATATTYTSQNGYPRYVVDVNGDGKADIVGFAANGVQVALSTGTGFNASSQWVVGFGSAAGYTTTTQRQMADLDGDGFPDIIGMLTTGTTVGKSARSTMPDMVTAISNGLGATTNIAYGSLTNPSLYTRGMGATYPQADLTVPWYVVSSVKNPNGLGSGYITTNYQYGALRIDFTGRGLLGFGWMQAANADTTLSSRTFYRQDWPYQGLPWRVERLLPGQGASGLVGLTSNTYGCLNPQSGSGCTVAAGNRYFTYISQSVESNWDTNGTVLPTVTTGNIFDNYGNATQITVATTDGYSKTTTNTFINDNTNWFLGRLTRSAVTTAAGAAGPNTPSGAFQYSPMISANTTNYNLKAAAVAVGWGQITPLIATVTINSGVYIWSDSTALPAFDTGSGFPAGSAISIVNNGYIMGKGGKGGGYPSINGEGGGTAINTALAISVTNSAGYILGGGGGGAGYTNTFIYTTYGGGGGGAGGGVGGDGYASNGQTYTYGGAGGAIGANGANGANSASQNGGGGGRVAPSITTNGPSFTTFGSSGGYGGSGGGTGFAYVSNTGTTVTGGSGGGAGVAGGNGYTSGSVGCQAASGGGGGWGVAGGYGAGTFCVGSVVWGAPGAAGNAINTNGNAITWTGGFPTGQVYGAVN